MNVTFHAPAIGRTHVPMGIAGPGEVSWTAEGIRIKGHFRSQTLAHALGCLGVIAAFGGGIALIIKLDIEPSRASGKMLLVAMIAVAAALIWLGRALPRPVERELVIPWNKLKKLAVDGQYVTFVSKAKPRGQVWFSAAIAPSALLDQIASAAPR